MARRIALVLGNADDADPGFIGERAAERGYDLVTQARNDARADPVVDPDLVIVLGSEWSVYWADVAGPVAAEQALLRGLHAHQVPIFGICYGAQILASTLGGSVEPSDAGGELGWFDIEVGADSHATLPFETGPWFQWHSDVFTSPADAEILAASPVGPQAFALGRTFAVQFHPEVTPAIVRRWADGGKAELEDRSIDRETLLTRTAAETLRSRGAAHALFDWFLYRFATEGQSDR